ncbi:MAG: glycosyltransferase family 2 protein [Bacteroidota bacterium]|nr:glycosyltransferase family 2 protein [Bacteroidota bacterium]
MVSIILCTYNRADLLLNAIRSVLQQTQKEWELIIIDDGSNDKTYNIVKQFLRKDLKIIYCYQNNQGLASARNRGLAIASGDFNCFVDSDDELAPLHLEKRLRYMKQHPSIDFIHGGVTLIGPKEKHYVADMTNSGKKIHLSKCHIGGTFFFRRKVLKKVNGFRSISYGEDFDFYTRVERYFSVRKVNFPTYIYHLDSENRLCDIFTDALTNKKPDTK